MVQRLDWQETFASERRRLLMKAILEEPGINFGALGRSIGLPKGTLRHHLNVLQRGGFVLERRHAATLRYFPAEHPDNWIEVVIRREPALAMLHDWLKLNPQATQSAVLESMSAHGWVRSTTQHRLARLVEGGLATLRLQGRFKLYSASTLTPDLPSGMESGLVPLPAPSRQQGRSCRRGEPRRFTSASLRAPALQVHGPTAGPMMPSLPAVQPRYPESSTPELTP